MTDIETLLRDTFAAHEHLADQPSPALRPARRRATPLFAVAAVVVVLALAAASVLLISRDNRPGPTGGGQASPSPTAPDLRDQARAREESRAQLLLTQAAKRVVRFPGGATAVDSSAVTELANLTTYAVDGHRTVVLSTYWTTAVRDPSGVAAWFAQHPVAGFSPARGPRYVEHPGGTPREELRLVPAGIPQLDHPEVLLQALPHGDGVAFRVTIVVHY